jgi:protein-disulfide isomerase
MVAMKPFLLSRLLLCCALALSSASPALAQSGSWFDIKDDDGKPVSNMRAPVELTVEVDRLKGVNAIGAAAPIVTIVEFMDYNCPFCRKAANDLETLARANSAVKVRLVQNAITSEPSKAAARVDLAAFRLGGARVAYELHRRLYARRGVNDANAALGIGAELGLDRAQLQAMSDSAEIEEVLNSHMTLAAALGMNATPSFLINGVIVSGYPGPDTIRRLVASLEQCDALSC